MPYKPNLRQPYPNELYHFGILGQKWGVRRYQNPDGTLTDAGRRHYGYSPRKEKRLERKLERFGDPGTKVYAKLHGDSLERKMRREIEGKRFSNISDKALSRLMDVYGDGRGGTLDRVRRAANDLDKHRSEIDKNRRYASHFSYERRSREVMKKVEDKLPGEDILGYETRKTQEFVKSARAKGWRSNTQDWEFSGKASKSFDHNGNKVKCSIDFEPDADKKKNPVPDMNKANEVFNKVKRNYGSIKKECMSLVKDSFKSFEMDKHEFEGMTESDFQKAIKISNVKMFPSFYADKGKPDVVELTVRGPKGAAWYIDYDTLKNKLISADFDKRAW